MRWSRKIAAIAVAAVATPWVVGCNAPERRRGLMHSGPPLLVPAPRASAPVTSRWQDGLPAVETSYASDDRVWAAVPDSGKRVEVSVFRVVGRFDGLLSLLDQRGQRRDQVPPALVHPVEKMGRLRVGDVVLCDAPTAPGLLARVSKLEGSITVTHRWGAGTRDSEVDHAEPPRKGIVPMAYVTYGFPARFVALHPRAVAIEANGAGGVRIRLGHDGDELPPADVLHVRYQQLPMSVRGIGPLEWLGSNLVSAAALERYAADIAQHGVWAVLTHPGNLDQQQVADLKLGWQTNRAADPSAPAVLSGGVEFDVLSMSPKDMALLDLRVFDEQRIASAFGVPPFLIGLPNPGGMTYSNASSLFDFHWRGTLRTIAQSIARPLSRWALPGDQVVEFNRDEYVRPDLAGRAAAYQQLHGISDESGRALTVTEIRRAESLAPWTQISDGIVPLVEPTDADDDADDDAQIGATQ